MVRNVHFLNFIIHIQKATALYRKHKHGESENQYRSVIFTNLQRIITSIPVEKTLRHLNFGLPRSCGKIHRVV